MVKKNLPKGKLKEKKDHMIRPNIQKTLGITMAFLLILNPSLSAECNEGVKRCKACLPGGNKCSECSEKTLILTSEGRCLECKDLSGCKKDQCDQTGCKVCEDDFLKEKNEKLGFIYCKRKPNQNLKIALWIGIPLFLVLVILIAAFVMMKRKEGQEDLYDKLLSTDKSRSMDDENIPVTGI